MPGAETTRKIRVLVVDDIIETRENVRKLLFFEDDIEIVGTASNGREGVELAGQLQPDVVLMDINMPGMGGLAACRTIRKDKNVAIIMLTVRDSEEDKVAALDAGADDFVTKPFSTPELLARIRAVLRRVPALQSSSDRIRIGSLIIDFGTRAVTREGSEPIHLTPKELDLLRYLTQRANQIVSHRELLQAVWGADYGREVDYLRVFIKNLRKKIELNPDSPEYITTEPWVGYRFNGTPQSL